MLRSITTPFGCIISHPPADWQSQPTQDGQMAAITTTQKEKNATGLWSESRHCRFARTIWC